MGGLILILPVLAFDVWLLATTGKKQFKIWTQARAWPRLAGAAGLGVALGVWLAFFIQYNWDAQTRAEGFPIPDAYSRLENGRWSAFLPPPSRALQLLGIAANFLSGLAAPLIPFKAAEFLRSVKAELSP
jgi:hypothetical protein